MIHEENITTRYADMPSTVRGFVRENPDDTYTVVLNSRLSKEMNAATYRHELQHIECGDPECEESAGKIEAHVR